MLFSPWLGGVFEDYSITANNVYNWDEKGFVIGAGYFYKAHYGQGGILQWSHSIRKPRQ